MRFSLMHGYDHINLVAALEPVAAVRDDEIGERIKTYTKLFPAGSPDFGHAVQVGDAWRIVSLGATDPTSARYGLASHLRIRAEKLDDAALASDLRAAAAKLDPEEGEQLAKDEWELGDRRYRIIRVEKFTLLGTNGLGMEPPRATDVDPAGSGSLADHLIDPRAPAGQWEAQLRLNLVGYLPIPGTVPDEVEADARHAVRTHPGVVLLPPTFVMVEIKDGAWEPLTGADGPGHARDHLAGYFAQLLPRLREFQGDPATPDEIAAWSEAAVQIESMPGPDYTALDRRFRTVRVSRLLRLGRDGPEPPRPTDQSHYGYP